MGLVVAILACYQIFVVIVSLIQIQNSNLFHSEIVATGVIEACC